MLRIGLNGYGRIGRYFSELASKTHEIELTINHIREDPRVSNGKLNIDGYRINWITSQKDIKFSDIPWSGLDCIIEAAIVASTEQLEDHLKNANYVVMTGTPKNPVFTYNQGFNDSFDGSQKIIGFGDDRAQIAGPLIRVLRDNYCCRKVFISTVRPPYTSESDKRVDTIGDSKRFVQDVEVCEILHFDPNSTLCKMILVCDVERDKEADVIQRVRKRFPSFNVEIIPVEKRYTGRMSFAIEYDPVMPYTKLLYDFVRKLKPMDKNP